MQPSPAPPTQYLSDDSDNRRWLGFEHRPGDVVISTRSKSGTTWMQMICALLIFQTPDLPKPLWELSPWLDWRIEPIEVVKERLAGQAHRRFIKTHTPLNGLPLKPDVNYIVVARHPLDAAVSLYHQGNNLDRERLAELTGQEQPASGSARPPVAEWMHEWVTWEGNAEDELDSLPGFMLHLNDAWDRRHQPNVTLVHYKDLLADLEGEMRRLATVLEIEVPESTWPQLVQAAGFEHMRANAADLAPANAGILKDTTKFFRVGSAGDGGQSVADHDQAYYHDRARSLAPEDLLDWLHRNQGSER